MKIAFNILLNIFRWIIISGIILFSIATFMGKAYGQTIVLWLVAALLFYWPEYFTKRWNKLISITLRILAIVVLILVKFIFFPMEPKTSIYLSETHRERLMEIYDHNLNDWPEDTEDIYIQTDYGKVHLLVCGSKENPPLIMIHAASMGAHSWAENIEPLIDHYRIYSFDNPGEGNKSQLNDVMVYPYNGEEIAKFYASLADTLGIKQSPVFGASNGGFIAMNYTYYYPEKVESLALFGPMGLTQLSKKSFLMLSLASMYPFDFIRDHVANWALGDNEYVNKKYGDWFNCIMEGTIPSMAQPVPMTTDQKSKMDLPVLLFLGTKDGIVGDAEFAKQTAMEYPNIKIEVLESGHMIAVEHAEYVNKQIKRFLNIE